MRARGFTLVELGIVILIIGVCAAVAVPNFGSDGSWRTTRACAEAIRTLSDAFETERLDHPQSPAAFTPAGIESLKGAGYLRPDFPRDHADPSPFVLVPGSGEVACVEHGLPCDERRWMSPREQLSDRRVTDEALLARMSTRPVSTLAHSARVKARALKAFAVFAMVFFVLLACQAAARASGAKGPGEQAQAAITVGVAVAIGAAAYVVTGMDPGPVPARGPAIVASVAPVSR